MVTGDLSSNRGEWECFIVQELSRQSVPRGSCQAPLRCPLCVRGLLRCLVAVREVG